MAVGSLFTIVASVLLSILSGIFAYHRCPYVEGMQEQLNERVLVLDKMLIECGRKNGDDDKRSTGSRGDQTFGMEMQPCLSEVRVDAAKSRESLKVDEVAEEATESVISIVTPTC